MTEIALFDAKNRLSELVQRVQAGEVFVITRRGKVLARLTKAEEEDGTQRAQQAIAALRTIRAGVSLGGLSSRELMSEGRR